MDSHIRLLVGTSRDLSLRKKQSKTPPMDFILWEGFSCFNVSLAKFLKDKSSTKLARYLA